MPALSRLISILSTHPHKFLRSSFLQRSPGVRFPKQSKNVCRFPRKGLLKSTATNASCCQLNHRAVFMINH